VNRGPNSDQWQNPTVRSRSEKIRGRGMARGGREKEFFHAALPYSSLFFLNS